MAAPLQSLLRKFRNLFDRVAFNMGAYRPNLPAQIDNDLLVAQAVDYFSHVDFKKQAGWHFQPYGRLGEACAFRNFCRSK
jgi:hypothetical protein